MALILVCGRIRKASDQSQGLGGIACSDARASPERDYLSSLPLANGVDFLKLNNSRIRLQSGISALVYSAAMVWLSKGGFTDTGTWGMVPAFLAAHLALWSLWGALPDRLSPAGIALGAVAVRAFLIPTAPSDDVFRYLWEGRIQNHGYNPFLLAPDHPILAPLRAAYWGRINHPNWPSIYFPFLQFCFRVVSACWESVLGVKLLAILFDLGALACLLGALRQMRLPSRHALLYALNPLVILYTAGEGHFESVFLFWIALGVWSLIRGRSGWGLLALGMACMSNPKGLVLLPFFLRRENFKAIPLLMIPCLLWIPFAASGREALASPFRFAGHFHFNGLAYNLFSAFLPPSAALGFCLLLLLFALAWIFLLEHDPIRSALQAYFAFLLCAPTVHPWYLIPLTVGLVLYRSPHWGAWMASVAFVFPVYARHSFSGSWRESGPLWLIEYGSWLAVWAYVRFTRPLSIGTKRFAAPSRVSVVIPTFNERENIVPCVLSILSQSGPRPDIIFADGGSRDGTREAAAGMDGVRVICGPPGRGIQIADGIAAATGDLLLIVHADSRLEQGGIARMLALYAERPDAPGGAFGMYYDDARLRFRCLASANNLRARLTGIAFGDQAQFFRRETLADGFPRIMLREDVELSLRLKRIGPLLFIPKVVRNSSRRWNQRGFFRNARLVIGLTVGYLIRKRLGLEAGSDRKYHAGYYGQSSPS